MEKFKLSAAVVGRHHGLGDASLVGRYGSDSLSEETLNFDNVVVCVSELMAHYLRFDDLRTYTLVKLFFRTWA